MPHCNCQTMCYIVYMKMQEITSYSYVMQIQKTELHTALREGHRFQPDKL